MKKLRLGMVGAGNIAKAHLDSYMSNPNVEIAAICDFNETTLKATADKYKIEKAFLSEKEMLENVELDAVDVCVWNCSHAECSIMALNKGLDVLCEKPMAMNAKEAEEMLEAAKKNEKLLMLGFVTRFSNEAKVTKDFIEKGYLGDIYMAKATYVRRNGNPSGWFSDKSRSGGGPVIDIGVHPLDLTRYLMGNPKPVSVYAATYDLLHESRAKLRTKAGWMPAGANPETDVCDVEDSAIAIIRYDNGATTLLEASYAINGSPKGERNLYGTKGGIDLLDGKLVLHSDVNGFMSDSQLLDLDHMKESKGMFKAEMDHFVDCCLNKTKCMSPAEDGVEVMKILDAIYESAKTGHEVIIK